MLHKALAMYTCMKHCYYINTRILGAIQTINSCYTSQKNITKIQQCNVCMYYHLIKHSN